MVFVVGKHGECEPNAGLLAWLLLFRGNFGSDDCYFDDRESRSSMVYLLLHDGLQTMDPPNWMETDHSKDRGRHNRANYKHLGVLGEECRKASRRQPTAIRQRRWSH